MDRIYIKDLEVYAFHGVNAEEKAMGQKFLISLELMLNLREAGKNDDLSKTVNYALLCNQTEKIFTSGRHNLLEKCAEELAQNILTENPAVEGVKVLIKKPWAPIGKILGYAAVEITRNWHKAYIGLGSNMGEKDKNLENALKEMENKFIKVIRVSGFYETKPVGYAEQDDFLNCAAEIRTLLTPAELIKELLDIEKKLKRVRTVKWGPRTIDLDILLYDQEIMFSEEITIPHPRMHERLFVLEPLAEIAPYAVHPAFNKTIEQLKNELLNLSNN